jgi:two-component system, LytTR family, response regulator
VNEERSSQLRVLVADDELLARQRLTDLLNKRKDVQLVREAASGNKAAELIRNEVFDLVFLDVRMPGLSGPEVVQKVGVDQMPVTVFVTAFDEYALKAFDLAAVDYLLKPFDDQRFERAMVRASRIISMHQVDLARKQLLALLKAETDGKVPDMPSAPDTYIERIPVDMRGQTRVVQVDDIEYFTASGPYVELHVGEQLLLIRERMQHLEDRLNPTVFVRIHRSTIVRIDLIETILHSDGGDYAVRLKGGQRLKVSRGRRALLSERLGITQMNV